MTAFYRIMLMWGLLATASAMEAPRLAEKGVESYQKGELKLARQYFTRAMRQAVLQARKDWVAMAVMNLADLELESGNLAAVKKLLDNLPLVTDPELLMLVTWKRSQYLFRDGMGDSALRLAAPLAETCRSFRFCREISTDVLRIRLELAISREGPLTRLKTEIQQFKSRLPKDWKASTAVLEALIAMREQRYGEASQHWENAIAFHRRLKHLARMAQCLNYLALSQFMENKPQKAIETNAMAVGVYKSIGLETAGLRAYTLNIFLVSDKKRLEEVKANLELVSENQPRLDLKSVVKDYCKFAQLSIPGFISGTEP